MLSAETSWSNMRRGAQRTVTEIANSPPTLPMEARWKGEIVLHRSLYVSRAGWRPSKRRCASASCFKNRGRGGWDRKADPLWWLWWIHWIRKGSIQAKNLPDVVGGKLLVSPAPIDLRVQNTGAFARRVDLHNFRYILPAAAACVAAVAEGYAHIF